MTSDRGWLTGLDRTDPSEVDPFPLRVVNHDDTREGDPAEEGLLDERPEPIDQDESDIAWQVRRLRINDEARTRYNAERHASSVPDELDVAAVIRGEVDPLRATMLTRTDRVSLIYPGLLHWIYSPPSHGKTMVALYASAQLLGRGGHVGYLDWEGNRAIVGDRLGSVGIGAETAASQFHYYRPGNVEALTEWLTDKAEHEWHLCVLDGAAKALAASGRNEESNPDVLAWLEAVVTPITAAGCAVLVLDHVTKDPENRSQARGAGAKGGEVSGAAWELKIGQPFNRKRAGFVRLIQRKEREGWTGVDGECVAELHVTPRRGRTHLELRPPAASAVDQARFVLMEKVWRAARDWALANGGKAPSTSEVFRVAGGDKATLSAILDELASLGYLTKAKDGQAYRWTPGDTPYLAPVMDAPPTLSANDWDVLNGE